ncbi:MAG: hypothetical protein AB7D57_12085 [Desulfovibrionaceae bacterium]
MTSQNAPITVAKSTLTAWWPLLLGTAAALVAVQYIQLAVAGVTIAGIAVRLLELWLLAGYAMTLLSTLAEVAPGRAWYKRYFHDSGWAFIKLFGWGLAVNLLGSVAANVGAGMGQIVGGVVFVLISGIQYMLMSVFLACAPDLDFSDAVRGTFWLIRRAPRWCVLLMFVNPGIPLAGGWAVTQLPAVLHLPGTILVALAQQGLGLALVTVLISIRVADWRAAGSPTAAPATEETPDGAGTGTFDMTPEPEAEAKAEAAPETTPEAAPEATPEPAQAPETSPALESEPDPEAAATPEAKDEPKS